MTKLIFYLLFITHKNIHQSINNQKPKVCNWINPLSNFVEFVVDFDISILLDFERK